MRALLTIILLFSISSSFAVDFTSLSRKEAVTTTYETPFKSYVDVSLFLNLAEVFQGSAYIRISYIIGADTLNDNIKVDGNYNSVVKQLFLDEGERLLVTMYLNNSGTEAIEGLEGSLRVVRNPEFEPSVGKGKNVFLSGVWNADQTPLFRVSIQDAAPETFRLKVDLNENYEYDKLYLKIKVISPSAGILMFDKQVNVAEGSALQLRKKTFTVDLDEVDLSTPGTYYFQVMQNIAATRVNGIDQIGYEIVPQ